MKAYRVSFRLMTNDPGTMDIDDIVMVEEERVYERRKSVLLDRRLDPRPNRTDRRQSKGTMTDKSKALRDRVRQVAGGRAGVLLAAICDELEITEDMVDRVRGPRTRFRGDAVDALQALLDGAGR